jgi:LysM repeat protein
MNVKHNLQRRPRLVNRLSLLVLLLCMMCARTGLAQYSFKFDQEKYPWMHPELSMMQFFNRDAIQPFYNAWKGTESKKLVLVYMGDSHVQCDILPGQVRKILQSEFGAGGQGMVFPYSTAKTYSSVEYKTTHTGEWEYAKSFRVPPALPLGVSGMTARTIDSLASFTLTFDKTLPEDYSTLRIYCKLEPSSYDLRVFCDGEPMLVPVGSRTTGHLPYIELTVPPLKNTLNVQLVKRADNQSEFQIYGMSILSKSKGGVIVHNVGVGAARYQSILYEALMPEQLTTLDPDLVILDFGTNDYLYDDKVKPELEKEIIKGINLIKAAKPGVSILLTSAHDLYRRGHNVRSGTAFSDLMRKIAREQHCLFFDWFWIAGGQTSMRKLQQTGLAQSDMIHLTYAGYKLKGQLLSDAFFKTMNYLEQNPTADSLVFPVDSLKKEQVLLVQKLVETPPPAGSPTKHLIRSGENLGSIALKYGVTVSQLKAWNNLHSDLIIAGKTLLVYRRGR